MGADLGLDGSGLDEAGVRGLLRAQHPDLAGLELRLVDGGWDNQQWRLGPDLAVRIPRTPRAPGLLDGELRWLPGLAERLPLPVPVPVQVGEPSAAFGHRWLVTRWVVGEPADVAPVVDVGSVGVLAGFLRALHQPAPVDAGLHSDRSAPLEGARAGFEHYFPLIEGSALAEPARVVVEAALSAPAWRGAPVWLHGDLHPANVVTMDGALAGVLDFGDMCAGDPATDLSAAWLLLPDGAASQFFDAYAVADDAMVARARGWAVVRALSLIEIGRNGRLGLPGGKPTWELAGWAALARAVARL